MSRKFALTAGVAIFVGIAVFYAFAPLLIFFEDNVDDVETRDVSETALIIPCYKAATIIEATLVAAKKVFPARQIFVIANGNSPTPLDETEDICKVHGVNHIWVPVGSKVSLDLFPLPPSYSAYAQFPTNKQIPESMRSWILYIHVTWWLGFCVDK